MKKVAGSHIRNHLIGEPYKIKQPNELHVWDNATKEWKPVIGNEELSKHAPIKAPGMFNWGYSNKNDEIEGMIRPIRGEFIFWDQKIGVYREVTRPEARDYLFSKLFLWPKDPNLWPKYK